MTAAVANWESVSLKFLCEPIEKLAPADTNRSSVRYIDISSVDGQRHCVAEAAEIPAATAPSRCRQLVAVGDTIFSTVRPYLEKVALIDASLDGEFASTGFAVLRPGERLEPRFLYYFATSRAMLDQVLPLQRGVSYPAVLDREVRSALVPVPPLAEQRRIVSLLEDHLSRLNAASDDITAATRRLASLRERLVLDAVTGKSIEGARVAADLPAAGTLDGELADLPMGWRWARLGEVADVVGGVTKDAKKQSDPALPEVSYLRVANVQRARLDLEHVTSIRVPLAKVEALRLLPGDVLMNEGGDRDKLARGWVWEGQIDDCIHQNHVFRARVTDPDLDPYFLSWTTNTIGGRWAERNGRQSVNLASISLRTVRLMPVVVPAPGVATRVVRHLHDQLKGLDRLQGELDSAAKRGQSLRRALLTAAFSGRLTGAASDLDRVEELVDA